MKIYDQNAGRSVKHLDKEKVAKALSICVPETQDDSKLECSDCPYGAVCNPNDIVGIPLPLIWDIRSLLKEREAFEPIPPTDESDLWKCGNCNHQLFRCTHQKYCEMCGKAVKWEGESR